jgi:DASH complex subunit DAD2
MSRQSVAANRPSHVAGSNAANSAAAAAKFLEKKKEFDAVSALQRASALYLQRIEGLADDCETMADAGQSN